MRYMKALLASIFAFLGLFTVVCYISWCITGALPEKLIECLYGGVGIECAVTGGMRVVEIIIDSKKKPCTDVPDGDMGRDGRAE